MTKSGTNVFHGSAFEYFRNNVLDAENFFAVKTQPNPEFRYNNFGGNVGGPVYKNKTFFFVNYEGSRQRIGITGSGTVPSEALRDEVLATSPQLTPILNMFPIGTSPTSDPNVDNYTTTSVSAIQEDTGSVRVDEMFTSADSVFARVNINNSYVHGPLLAFIQTHWAFWIIKSCPCAPRISPFTRRIFSTPVSSTTFWLECKDGQVTSICIKLIRTRPL